MSDHTLYDTTVPTAGSLALAHQQIVRLKQAGVFVNIAGDINNFTGQPTPIEVQREVYGTKGRQSKDIIGYNFAPTFNVEAVRDNTGAIAQSWLVDLVNAAFSEGEENKRELQFFDALDENLPAFEGRFSIAVAPLNTGFADKGGYSFTLTNDGVVEKITSPIASAGNPVLESALPAGLTVGDLLVVKGYKLASTISATIDTIAVTEFRVIDDNTVVLQIPASVAGSAPIIVTNGTGASTALAYVAA